ncbi:hypothetical protein T484DRAFT_1818210 [Baffinella frigidus]|nr:hypothetical protein T484DRAFT_1818210 [Cryptophyta sp. CCMP2293]
MARAAVLLITGTLLVAANAATVTKKAALLIDCFLDEHTHTGLPGSLAVTGAYDIVPVINSLHVNKCVFDLVVKTQDFHPADHTSFAESHGVPPYYNAANGGITLTCNKTPETGGKMSDASCCPLWNASANAFACPDPAAGCPQKGAASDEEKNPSCLLCRTDPDACFEMMQMMWPTHCLQCLPPKRFQ